MSTRRGRFPLALDQLAPGPQAQRTLLRPQRPVHDAARDARPAAAIGVGLDSAAVRERMVGRLRRGGIDHPRLLAAFAQVPRHLFVDTALANQAYEDTSLPIGNAQTISKPSVVARMLALLLDGRGARQRGTLGRVLEVGTGCGYQTALLGLLAASVVSVERIQPLHAKARESLRAWRHNTRLVWGDGRLGHPPNSPYDSIIAAAGGEHVPAAWVDQLADGGRIVAPCVAAAGMHQRLEVIDREGAQVQRRWFDAVHFVPLKSGIE
jgi:protein-L-isoaspartate(D-aspartate) O-methyltransferase